MKSLKELVSNDNKVNFLHYKHGELWYTTDCGFAFPVAISDTGDGKFLAQDRAITFMRYIRQHLSNLEKDI